MRCIMPTASIASLAKLSHLFSATAEYIKGSLTFSKTVAFGKRLKAWKTNPISLLRTLASSVSSSSSITLLLNLYEPPLCFSKKPRICKSVDFPEPEGPIIATNSPSSMLSVASCKARVEDASASPLYIFLSSIASIIGIIWKLLFFHPRLFRKLFLRCRRIPESRLQFAVLRSFQDLNICSRIFSRLLHKLLLPGQRVHFLFLRLPHLYSQSFPI